MGEREPEREREMHNRGDALRILWYYVIPTIFMAKSDDDTVLLTVLKVFWSA